MRRRTVLTAALAFSGWRTALRECSAAELPRIAVLYPDAAPPYSEIYDAIVTGIRQVAGDRLVHTQQLADGATASRLASALNLAQPDAVITLGTRASELYVSSSHGAPVVAGARFLNPLTGQERSGISLAPDPKRVLAVLTATAPAVQTVHVVLNPARDGWLEASLPRDADTPKVVIVPASTPRDAARAYIEIFEQAKGLSDALWLLNDAHLVGANDTLPYIVEESWRRRVPVISQTLLHARAGVLLAVYPDPTAHGGDLARMADERTQAGTELGIRLLASLNKAINVRTARRLGIQPSNAELREFDLVLPVR